VGRSAALAVVALLALPAGAGAEPDVARDLDPDFWQEVADPHGDEVRAVLERAQRLLGDASSPVAAEQDPTGTTRQRRLDDAYGMLRYARRLSPRHPDVLLALGRAAEESGRTDAAIDALTTYLAIVPAATGDAHLRLGALQLRAGRRAEALHHLREAQASRHPGTAGAAAVHLAAVLESEGRTADAIATLQAAVAPSAAGYWNSDAAMVAFALAVAYDRDEQVSSAWTALDRLQGGLSGSFAGQIQAAMSGLRLTPAVDLHYWRALLYESLGDLGEARAEWLHYAAGGEAARFRPRALAHVTAIDRMLADSHRTRRTDRRPR
jgi:tetratricopeptide (TPR) repeat protein